MKPMTVTKQVLTTMLLMLCAGNAFAGQLDASLPVEIEAPKLVLEIDVMQQAFRKSLQHDVKKQLKEAADDVKAQVESASENPTSQVASL